MLTGYPLQPANALARLLLHLAVSVHRLFPASQLQWSVGHCLGEREKMSVVPLAMLRDLGANLQQRRLGSETPQAVGAECWLGVVPPSQKVPNIQPESCSRVGRTHHAVEDSGLSKVSLAAYPSPGGQIV